MYVTTGHYLNVPVGDGRYTSILIGCVTHTIWTTRRRSPWWRFWRRRYERWLRLWYYAPCDPTRMSVSFPEGPQSRYVQEWARRDV